MRRYPLRSLLSVLGIVIGILAVSLMVSLGNAMQGYIVGQLTSFGTNIVRVNAKVPGLSSFGSQVAQVQGVQVTTLVPEDFEAMRQFPFVESVASYTSLLEWGVAGRVEKRLMVMGSTPNYRDIDEQAVLVEGRFLSDEDERSGARVVVLGSKAREDFFGAGDAVGGSLRIGSAHFQVIGVMKPRGQSFGFDLDTMVFIPRRTSEIVFTGVKHVQEGGVKIAKAYSEVEAAQHIEELMRRRHKIRDPKKDDFVVTTTDQAISIARDVTNIIRFLLIALSSISLFVGGVGIMNIMLVSVRERLHEIGVRKAFGAKREDIYRQFIVESATLSVLGGIFGTIGALIVILIAQVILRAQGLAWVLGFPFDSVLIALVVSAVVGVLFGLYPARRAAEIEIITALRTE